MEFLLVGFVILIIWYLYKVIGVVETESESAIQHSIRYFDYYDPSVDITHNCPNCGHETSSETTHCLSCGFLVNPVAGKTAFEGEIMPVSDNVCYEDFLSDINGLSNADKRAIVELYEKACYMGNQKAINVLAEYYDNFGGTPFLPRKRAEYVFLAAKSGEAKFQAKMGDLLYNGYGINQNKALALTYWAKAWANGFDANRDKQIEEFMTQRDYEEYIHFHEGQAENNDLVSLNIMIRYYEERNDRTKVFLLKCRRFEVLGDAEGKAAYIEEVKKQEEREREEERRREAERKRKLQEFLSTPPTGDYCRPSSYEDGEFCTNRDINICRYCIHKHEMSYSEGWCRWYHNGVSAS